MTANKNINAALAAKYAMRTRVGKREQMEAGHTRFNTNESLDHSAFATGPERHLHIEID
jgi:hypothetical protein